MGESKRRKVLDPNYGNSVVKGFQPISHRSIIITDVLEFGEQAQNSIYPIELPVEQGFFIVELALAQVVTEIPKDEQQRLDLITVTKDYRDIQSALFKNHMNQDDCSNVFIVPDVALSMCVFALRFLRKHSDKSFDKFIQKRKAGLVPV